MTTTVIVSPVDETPQTVVVTAPKGSTEVVVSPVGVQGPQGVPGVVGSNKQVQFNDNGFAGGATNLLWDKATNTLTVGGTLTANNPTNVQGDYIAGGNASDSRDFFLYRVYSSYTMQSWMRLGGNANIGFGSGNMSSLSSGVSIRLNDTYAGVRAGSGHSYSWSSNGNADNVPDLLLWRDAAGTLALRNGTNAQAFRAYNNYVDPANYSRIQWGYNAGATRWEFVTANAGTGQQTGMYIGTPAGASLQLPAAGTDITFVGSLMAGADNVYDIGTPSAKRPRHTYTAGNFYSGAAAYMGSDTMNAYIGSIHATGGINFVGANTARWHLQAAGHLLALTDNVYNIGASGANRPANVYVANSLTVGDFTTATNGIGSAVINAPVTIKTSADGILNLQQIGIAGTAGVKDPGWSYIQFLDSEGDRQAYFGINNVGDLQFNPEGVGTSVLVHSPFKFGTDNYYDIGAAGANRPRDIHVGGSLVLPITSDWNTKTNGRFSLYSAVANGAGGGSTVTMGAYFPHSSGAYGLQVSGRNSAMYFRTEENGVFGSWKTVVDTDSQQTLASKVLSNPVATGTVSLRDGVNPVSLYAYNMYTDSNNWERGGLSWATNEFRIGTEQAGTGAQRMVRFVSGGAVIFSIDSTQMIPRGNIVFSTDNTYDIGLSGGNRPRNVTAAGTVTGANVKTGYYTVATLPAAASSDGMRAMVSDANARTFDSIVAGGGTNKMPVWCDGTNWRIG